MTLPRITHNDKDPDEQWTDILAGLDELEARVLKAVTYDDLDRRGRIHVLALTNVRFGRRFIPGLDVVAFAPFPGESAFCGMPSTIPRLKFRIQMSRHEERRIGNPSCLICLYSVGRLTGLPTNNLAAAARPVPQRTAA